MPKGIYKRTEENNNAKGKHWKIENKSKMLGHIPWNKGIKTNKPSWMSGKHHSVKTRKKIGELQKGRRISEETKIKLSEAHKGKKHTTEWIKNAGNSHLGKKHTDKSKHKMSLARIGRFKGENNVNWKGGITPINIKIRNTVQSKLWRKSVFERDNFTCQKTKKRGGDLVAHHINNFADFPELRFAIDNGITLLKESHQEFHKKYGIKNNTKEQIEEFLQGLGILT